MKEIIRLYLFVLLIVATGCSSDKQTEKGLPCIDVTKNYPEKEILITDMADVHYLYLDTKEKEFLYKGGINYVTENTIVVVDRSSQSVLFFSKEGVPKSRFNRKGQGPEEYSNASAVMYDEEKDEVYVIPDFNNYIKVYSSLGEFKRRLTFPQINIGNQAVFFDDQSILVYDNTNLWRNINKQHAGDKSALTEQANDSSFFLMSRANGEVLEHIELASNNAINVSTINDGDFFGQIGYTRVRKSPDGLLLYNPETDTVFLYNKEKILTPFLHKKPLLNHSEPMVVMDICMDAGDFQFMAVYPYLKGEYPSAIYYMRDKKTDEIFRPTMIHPDYTGKSFHFDPRLLSYYEKGYHFELDFMELKEAYNENRLSGELKKLVATLDEEEGNNVFMLVQFK